MELIKELVNIENSNVTESTENQTEFSAHNIDSLIKVLQEIKSQYGNIGIAAKTPSGKWNTEGVSIEISKITAYNQTSNYACIAY